MGYFAYDSTDMILHAWHKSSTRVWLMHHIAVFAMFGIAARSQLYVSCAAVGLLCEISSMCLHARALVLAKGL